MLYLLGGGGGGGGREGIFELPVFEIFEINYKEGGDGNCKENWAFIFSGDCSLSWIEFSSYFL